jgi:hypothetical protein
VFHRPTKEFDLYETHSHKVAMEIEDDMIQYGYLLPNWIPLLTRHICIATATRKQVAFCIDASLLSYMSSLALA